MPPAVRVQREPPRERPINLEPLVFPVMVAGGLVFYVVYKDKINQLVKKVSDSVPSLDELLDNLDKILGSLPKPGPGPVSGGLWYKANGPTKSMPNVRCSTGPYGGSSGGNSGGNRWENVVSWGNSPGFEVVVYFTIPKGRMKPGENAGHIGLKHGGPEHTSPCGFSTGGACCCWWDTGIRQTGTVYAEVEHPHPNNIHEKRFGNIGRNLDTGQPLGVRWHIMKEGGNVRLKQWVDTSGRVGANQWRQTYDILDTFNGSLMPSDYKSHVFPTKLNIEIRISDVTCHDIKMNYGPVSRQITSSSSNVAYNMASDFYRVSLS